MGGQLILESVEVERLGLGGSCCHHCQGSKVARHLGKLPLLLLSDDIEQTTTFQVGTPH